MTAITRRDLLLAVPATLVATRPFARSLTAQGAAAPLRVRSLNHVGISVADPKRSIEFYRDLFGMAVHQRAGDATMLRVGKGPQFLSIGAVQPGAAPSIWHYCLGIEGFDVNRVLATLASKGVTKAGELGPMKATVSRSGDRDDLLFGDPDGIVCQIQDVSYCGGTGPLGNRCEAGTPGKGLIALTDLSHLTIFTSDPARSNKFYQDLFGLGIRSYQGPTAPTLAVGPSTQFLMFTGGGGRGGAPRPASINHACFTLDGFNPEDVTRKLESFGIKPRDAGPGAAGPLRHYISMRMENRGGAPGGTPELYFTDPDGLLMQLQDTSYCGGSGFLGNTCPK